VALGKSRDRPGASSRIGFAMAEPFDEEAFGKRIAASPGLRADI